MKYVSKYSPANKGGVIDRVKSAASYQEADSIWKEARAYLKVSAGTLAKVSTIIARRFPVEFAAANQIGE